MFISYIVLVQLTQDRIMLDLLLWRHCGGQRLSMHGVLPCPCMFACKFSRDTYFTKFRLGQRSDPLAHLPNWGMFMGTKCQTISKNFLDTWECLCT